MISDDNKLLALTAFLQAELDVIVTAAVLIPEGLWWLPPWQSSSPSKSPSSLVTVQDYARYGVRRLVLNIQSPLIQQMADALEKGCRDSVIALGKAMLRSATWPTRCLDVDVAVRWKAAPGVIALPDRLVVGPVPHVELVDEEDETSAAPSWVKRLAIWPLRVCSVQKQPQRKHDPCEQSPDSADKNESEEIEVQYQVTRAHELWEQRDEGLELEFRSLRAVEMVEKALHRSKGIWRFLCGSETVDPSLLHVSWQTHVKPDSGVITMAPSLPVFVMADVMLRRKSTTPMTAYSDAVTWLLRNDRLFGLSLFFGVPLMDRTGVLKQAVKIAPYSPQPPSKDEVESFLQRSDVAIDKELSDQENARNVLKSIMLREAEKLWQRCESSSHPGSIMVAWSGGIDSTAVLCALLQTSEANSSRLDRLSVLLDDESKSENPLFYCDQITKKKLRVVQRNDEPISTHALRWSKQCASNILVTGELGDQLFGSSKFAAAFAEKLVDYPCVWGIQRDKNEVPIGEQVRDLFSAKGLDAPWQETVLPALRLLNLIDITRQNEDWESWISEQLSLSTIDIRSTFDFLWWVNFSLKWQNVALRCVHDGGTPLLPLSGGVSIDSVTGCIEHFFGARDFELWACIPQFHKSKFPELADYTTYKEPMKHFIKQYDGDDIYYNLKKKVGSLNFGAPTGALSYTNQFYGAVLQSGPSKAVKALRWGVCGMSFPEDEGLVSSLDIAWVDAPLQDPIRPLSAIKRDRKDGEDANLDTRTCLYRVALQNFQRLDGRILDLSDTGDPLHFWTKNSRYSVVDVVTSKNDPSRDVDLKLSESKSDYAACIRSLKCESLERFAMSCQANSYDVVVVSEIGYTSNPFDFLQCALSIAHQAVLLDWRHPVQYEQGILWEDSHKETSILASQSILGLAHVKSHRGTASLGIVSGADSRLELSRTLIESFIRNQGWDVQRVTFDFMEQDFGQGFMPFCGVSPGNVLPERFMLLCSRQSLASQDEREASTLLEDTDDESLEGNAIEQQHFLSWIDLDSQPDKVAYTTPSWDRFPFETQAWGRVDCEVASRWSGGSRFSTTYGYVFEGPTELRVRKSEDVHTEASYTLESGMYFSVSDKIRLTGGCGVLHLVDKHRALFAIGGPIEAGPGRLGYIDGCTDTLLLSPVQKGAPCLNHLHFPPGIAQTQHTHPSGRSGMVLRGSGVCVCKEEGRVMSRTRLSPGMAFVIPTNVKHAFETSPESSMDVVAFHPDSDFGPTSDNHPMINRTIVDGVSASLLSSIKTNSSA